MAVRAGVVKLAEVAPATGSVVTPEIPRYHWKVGDVPDAATVKMLQDHVKAVIAPFKYPRRVVFIAALPKTESGKIQRFKLLEGRT